MKTLRPHQQVSSTASPSPSLTATSNDDKLPQHILLACPRRVVLGLLTVQGACQLSLESACRSIVGRLLVITDVASAVDVVFGTAELLEAVLLQADAMTVLRSRQVNETFRLAIQRSLAIQHKLFEGLVLERCITLDTERSRFIVRRCRGTSDGDVDFQVKLWEVEEKFPPLGISIHPVHRQWHLPLDCKAYPWVYKQRQLRGGWEDLRLVPAVGRSVKVKFTRAWVRILGKCSCTKLSHRVCLPAKVSHQVWEENLCADVPLVYVIADVMISGKRQRLLERRGREKRRTTPATTSASI